MKAKNYLLYAVATVLSSLVISCASAPEMSAEEERMSQGGEGAIASTSPSDSSAVSKEIAASTTKETTSEEKVVKSEENKPAFTDPGISESSVASNKESTLESLSENKAPATTEPTLVNPKEVLSKDLANSAPEALPLSGEMPSSEQVVTPSGRVSVDSTLDTSSLSTSSADSSLSMPSLSQEPTFVMPKKAASKKTKHKLVKPVATQESASISAPKESIAAREVDTRAAQKSVATQVNTSVVTTDKEGTKLNRFYFLRPGDHTEKVSELLYGNRNMASALLKWNGGVDNWIPGNRIHYASPVKKDDGELHSFYEESSVILKVYKVQKGDNLKVLAARFYGDIRCWSEIATINHLPADTSIVTAGQVLKLAPEKLGGTTVQAQVEKTAAPAGQPVVSEADDVDPFLAAEKERDINQIKKDKPETKKSLASADVGTFLMKNLFLILTVTLVLGLIIFMIRRRDKDTMEF